MNYLALPITLGVAAWMYLGKIHFPLGAYALWTTLFVFVSVRLLHHAQLLPGPMMSLCNSALRRIPKAKLEELRPEDIDSVAGDPVEMPDIAALAKSDPIAASTNSDITDECTPADPDFKSVSEVEDTAGTPELQDAPAALQADLASDGPDVQVAVDTLAQPDEVQVDDVQDDLTDAREPAILETEAAEEIGGLDSNAFPDFGDFDDPAAGDEEIERVVTLAERVEAIDDAGCSVIVTDPDALEAWAADQDPDDAFERISQKVRDEAEVDMWFVIRVSVVDSDIVVKGGNA